MRWATPSNRRTIASTQKPGPDLQIRKWQDLRSLRGEEIAVLASRYGVATKALVEAQKRGVLWAGAVGGSPTWVLTDSKRYVRQDARLDGSAIRLKAGTEVQKRTMGRPAWVVGLDRSRQYDHWLIVEGNTDALAAYELLLRHNELSGWGVGILLGAGVARSLHPKAIDALHGSHVVLGLDADTAGDAGAEALCAVLDGVARSINRVVLPVGRDLRDMLTA